MWLKLIISECIRYSASSIRRNGGIITNEMGRKAVPNGWVLAAVTVCLIDAPCNGRAHPLE